MAEGPRLATLSCRLGRASYFLIGLAMLCLAFVGTLLPVMPTTIFLILAVWCFGRSSPRLENWLLSHPTFGPTLRNWRATGAMPRRAKWFACGGMVIGYGVFLLGAKPSIWIAFIVAVLLASCMVYLITRPEA